MKYKSKIQTSSTMTANESNSSSSIASKDISYIDNKKGYTSKYPQTRLNKKQKSRQVNSLDELTKKFSHCVYNSESNKINLNTAMKKIKAKKRRIYDITNVLEAKLNL